MNFNNQNYNLKKKIKAENHKKYIKVSKAKRSNICSFNKYINIISSKTFYFGNKNNQNYFILITNAIKDFIKT